MTVHAHSPSPVDAMSLSDGATDEQSIAAAARASVVRVSAVLSGSRMRFTAARLVPSDWASSDTLMSRRSIRCASAEAITCFIALASTSPYTPSSRRYSVDFVSNRFSLSSFMPKTYLF